MPAQYKISAGDCVSSVAFEHGFFWKTIWDHPENASLKQQRKEPNVLMPDDVLTIPDLVCKEQACSAEQRHRFKLKGVPARLKVRLLKRGEPRVGEPYELTVEGKTRRGKTDGDGNVDCPIPPNARTGELKVGEGDAQDVFELSLGHLDPVESESGFKSRLDALGYNSRDNPESAIKAFQRAEGLTESGRADAATQSKLKEKYGR